MTKTIKLGNLKVGGRHPVAIKGMLKTSLENRPALLREAKRLAAEGAEAIRVAVKSEKDSKIVNYLKKYISLPLVADIHFHYQVALKAIEDGFDGIRLNPLNIYKKEQLKLIAQEAKKAKIPIRVGVNSGGFRKNFSSHQGLARAMVKEVEGCIKVLEREGFFDIMVSLKASSPKATIEANRIFCRTFNYPLHLGVTASGPFLEAITKSSIGIGALLCEGIGDIIRVSLTAPSFWEIRIAKHILQATGLRRFFPEIISCPTCSRCKVDLINIVDNFQKEITKLQNEGSKFPDKIAVMGCEVNGPGEAYQADIGVAFGDKRAVLFKKNKILASVSEAKAIKELIKRMGR